MSKPSTKLTCCAAILLVYLAKVNILKPASKICLFCLLAIALSQSRCDPDATRVRPSRFPESELLCEHDTFTAHLVHCNFGNSNDFAAILQHVYSWFPFRETTTPITTSLRSQSISISKFANCISSSSILSIFTKYNHPYFLTYQLLHTSLHTNPTLTSSNYHIAKMPFFNSRFMLHVHIIQIILVHLAIGGAAVRLLFVKAPATAPRSRANTMALGMVRLPSLLSLPPSKNTKSNLGECRAQNQ